MILVEGPDGAGNTTLVTEVCDLYGLEVGIRGTTNRDLLYTVTVHDTLRALGYAVQVRTLLVSGTACTTADFAYAPMMMREVAFNSSQQSHIHRMIAALRCPVRYASRTSRSCSTMRPVHHMEGVNEHLRRIYDTYYEMTFGDKARFPDIGSCMTTPTPTHWQYVLLEIEDYIDDRQERMTG